jgi:uncharacterized membrane protein
MQYVVGRSWYSWIPTNLGYLNFNYTADYNNLVNVFGENNFLIQLAEHSKTIILNETNLSDLNCFIKKALDINEAKSTAKIVLNNKTVSNKIIGKLQPSNICGTCNLTFLDNNNIILQINSKFNIERTGKIIIKDIIVDYEDEYINTITYNDILNQTIANAIYTLIKKIIHGDNHHYQKVDTMIGVYAEFEPRQILTDLGFQLKRLEKFVKTDDTKSLALIYDIDKKYAYNTAIGFQSYIQTFYNLFIKNKKETQLHFIAKKNIKNKKETQLHFITKKNIKNVILSIKSGVLNHKSKKEEEKSSILFIVSLLALFSTLNIFYSSMVDKSSKLSWFLSEYAPSRDAITLLSFLIILYIPFFKKPIYTFILKKLRFLIKEKKHMYSLFELFILVNYTKNMSDETRKLYSKNIEIFNKFKYKIRSFLISFPLSFLLLSVGIYKDSIIIIIISIGYIIFAILYLKSKVTTCQA